MKIILAYPNFKWKKDWENSTAWKLYPYNLCLLAAMVEDKHDVVIVDMNFANSSKEDFSKIIEKEKPDLVCLSILTDEYQEAVLIASKIVKDTSNSIKTIIGGVSAISNPDPLISDESVDYVIVGEGEYVFKELCDYFNNKGKFPEKGVWHKKDNKIIKTGRVDFIQDLDALPLPAYHKIDFLKYAYQYRGDHIDNIKKLPYGHLWTSRGCPYNCSFCQVGTISGKKPRCRSPENVIKEIEYLIKNYNIKSLAVDDDNLLIDKDRAKKLFRMMIDKKFNLDWYALSLAVYKLDDEMIDLMEKSGCVYVDIAIESGVERVLRNVIHKPVELNYAKKMIKKLKETKIFVAANFVIGFPDETWSEIRQSLKFAESLDVDYIKLNIATPLVGTELYKITEGKKCLKDYSPEKHSWTESSIETREFRTQDIKILRAYEWDRLNFTDPERKKKIIERMGITEQRLNEIRNKTFERANP